MSTSKATGFDDAREMRALKSASLAGDDVPTRVLLAPWGKVESANGSFVVDDESARLAARAFEEHGTDLPIDYEHQTLGGRYSSPNGKAPAAGWIKKLVAVPKVGLFADIAWTTRGAEMLAAGEYRYLSPVAIIRKTDRKLVAIHSAALTNKPAIVDMPALVNRSKTPADGVSDAVVSALRSELGLEGGADVETVLAAAGERLEELQRERDDQRVAQRIREAAEAGKLVDAQRAWAQSLARRDQALFDEWLRTAPVVVNIGATVPPVGEPSKDPAAAVVASRARTEFRANPDLGTLTTEEAFVQDALARRRASPPYRR